ncbi:hypothetical protein ACFPFX_32855 [Streptomyces mauvecolor]|uniref:Uncharacterized protein n=1 Tax=Streptomyces mauvecolor TaxID=58345 RepID=A0ABV9UV75_9ACTN
MSLLNPSELAAFAYQVAPLLGTQCRALPDDSRDDAVRIVDDEGRALLLYQEEAKPQRLFVTVRLPEAAEAAGFTVRPVTVAAGCTPAHAAAHIRRRLLPAHARVLAAFHALPTGPADVPEDRGADVGEADSPPSPSAVQRATAALTAVAPACDAGSCDGWVIGERPSRRRSLPAVWWQTARSAGATEQAGNGELAMAPFLADALRRAGLVTTEPRHGRWVFFAAPPQAPDGPRYTAEASPERRASWDVMDRHTGAKVRGSGDQEHAAYFAESLNTEHDVRQKLHVASLELPGIQAGAEEEMRLRVVAVALARRGFAPYGLDAVDHADVPGFLVVSCSNTPGQVAVHRVLDPWGSTRPEPGNAGAGTARRFDRDLAAYARCLNGPGRRAAVDGEHVRVQITETA